MYISIHVHCTYTSVYMYIVHQYICTLYMYISIHVHCTYTSVYMYIVHVHQYTCTLYMYISIHVHCTYTSVYMYMYNVHVHQYTCTLYMYTSIHVHACTMYTHTSIHFLTSKYCAMLPDTTPYLPLLANPTSAPNQVTNTYLVVIDMSITSVRRTVI